jgi:hypothetical protein
MVTNTEDSKLTPTLTDAETVAAEKQGVKNAVTQSAQTNFATQSATENNDEYAGDKWPDRHEIMQWSHLVDLGLDEFKAAIKDGAVPNMPESKIAGLLELERSGKNRTEYVEALCKRLGVKSPLEVTSAGPGHTNDVTSLTKLKT